MGHGALTTRGPDLVARDRLALYKFLLLISITREICSHITGAYNNVYVTAVADHFTTFAHVHAPGHFCKTQTTLVVHVGLCARLTDDNDNINNNVNDSSISFCQSLIRHSPLTTVVCTWMFDTQRRPIWIRSHSPLSTKDDTWTIRVLTVCPHPFLCCNEPPA